MRQLYELRAAMMMYDMQKLYNNNLKSKIYRYYRRELYNTIKKNAPQCLVQGDINKTIENLEDKLIKDFGSW
jgi:hypothetical protein